MKITNIAHNLLKNSFIQETLYLLSFLFLRIEGHNKKNKIFITIDVESGYLKANNERVWMKDEPMAKQGYIDGLENYLSILDKYKVKATLFVSTQCFSLRSDERKRVCKILTEAFGGGHEIGLHIHPKEDQALQNNLGTQLRYTSSRFYKKKEIDEIIKAGKELIKENLGNKIFNNLKSFRWANFAADKRVFAILTKNGFRVDSTICSGIMGHLNDDRFFDWRSYKKNVPYKIGKIIELPITTFRFFRTIKADFSYGKLLFNLLKKRGEIVLITHSTEGTYKDGSRTYVVENLEKFIVFSKKKEVKFATLNELHF